MRCSELPVAHQGAATYDACQVREDDSSVVKVLGVSVLPGVQLDTMELSGGA